jgi:hypothetical protein
MLTQLQDIRNHMNTLDCLSDIIPYILFQNWLYCTTKQYTQFHFEYQ